MEWEAKIKQQQNLYETARTERTVNSRKVLESQNEIDEMKRKFKLMNQLVEQLKEEINSKDIALIKEHYDHQKVYTSKASLVIHHGVFCLLSSHNIVLLPLKLGSTFYPIYNLMSIQSQLHFSTK
jgi:CTP synthase (UTP-ammonia lyase)